MYNLYYLPTNQEYFEYIYQLLRGGRYNDLDIIPIETEPEYLYYTTRSNTLYYNSY